MNAIDLDLLLVRLVSFLPHKDTFQFLRLRIIHLDIDTFFSFFVVCDVYGVEEFKEEVQDLQTE
jgi:hypothetical protein